MDGFNEAVDKVDSDVRDYRISQEDLLERIWTKVSEDACEMIVENDLDGAIDDAIGSVSEEDCFGDLVDAVREEAECRLRDHLTGTVEGIVKEMLESRAKKNAGAAS